ncbi:hypothetical protein VV02_25455 [Luteipulveratus mongoliensis]|uniref:HTH luxR-type domain-containing protein n=1 Tax=Luteipulveratus mongoliensis TaxID=571913 RepID=A0A0K1JPA1_9MICO|nr:hypothetical protein VV02_25455 [Luteipulveratus mongoliensis]
MAQAIDYPSLTDRQLQILGLLAQDQTDEAIATRLKLTSRTVRAEVARLYDTFEVRSRFGLGMAYLRWQGHRRGTAPNLVVVPGGRSPGATTRSRRSVPRQSSSSWV